MPRHAAAAGSAIGGFIEGVTGGFKDTTEFRRQRRLEQQVAEQISAETAQQGLENERTAADRKQAAADRERAQRLADIKFFLETGIDPTPGGALSAGDPTAGASPSGIPKEGFSKGPSAGTPVSELSEKQRAKLGEFKDAIAANISGKDIVPTPKGAAQLPKSVTNLRSAAGANILEDVGAHGLPRQAVSPTATQVPGADPQAVGVHLLGQDAPEPVDPTDAFLERLGVQKLGLSAAEREAVKRSGALSMVAEFMALSPEEREAALQDPAVRQALDEVGKFDEMFDLATAGSTARFGVTAEGHRTFSGGTREQADAFALEFPAGNTRAKPEGPRISFTDALDLVRSKYTVFGDRGEETFSISEEQLIENAIELSRTGKFPAEPREAPHRSLSGIGNFAAPESQFRGVGPLRSFANAPVPVIPRASTPNEVPSDDILQKLVQRFGEDEEAIVAELKRLGYRTD